MKLPKGFPFKNLALSRPSPQTWFLPSPEKVIGLLGGPDNTYQLIKLLENEYGLDSKVSKRSLYRLSGEGIGKATQRKLAAFVQKILQGEQLKTSLPLLRNIVKSRRLGSSAGAWLSHIHGYTATTPAPEFTHLCHFIEKRCLLELKLSSEVLKKVQKDNIAECAAFNLEIAINHTLIPEKLAQEGFTKIIANHPEHPTLSQDLGIFAVHMELDFYFSALAHLDLDTLMWLEQAIPGAKVEYPQWFESGLWTTMLPRQKATLPALLDWPFSRLLNNWRHWLARSMTGARKPISWNKLASYIPVDNPEETKEGYTLQNKQKDLLKEWRDGRRHSYPSSDKLDEWILALLGQPCREQLWMKELATIAIGLDKLINKHREALINEIGCSNEQAAALIEQVYSHYSTHWHTHKKRCEVSFDSAEGCQQVQAEQPSKSE